MRGGAIEARRTRGLTEESQAALAVAALTANGRGPSVLADACAVGARPARPARRDLIAGVDALNGHVDIERAGHDLGDAHAVLGGAEDGGEVAREVVRVEYVFGGELEAERQHHKRHLPEHDPAMWPAADDDVELLLPRRVGIGAARVVDGGLAHREVERVRRRHVRLERRHQAALDLPPVARVGLLLRLLVPPAASSVELPRLLVDAPHPLAAPVAVAEACRQVDSARLEAVRDLPRRLVVLDLGVLAEDPLRQGLGPTHEHLDALHIRVEEPDHNARLRSLAVEVRGGRLGEACQVPALAVVVLASNRVRQAELDLARIGARKREVVCAIDGHSGRERRLELPAAVENVHVATSREGRRRDGAVHPVCVHILDNEARGDHRLVGADPRVPLVVQAAPLTVHTVAPVRRLAVRAP